MTELRLQTESNQRYLWFELSHDNYEYIKRNYPRFYDRFYEMQEILKAQGRILDDIEIAFEIVLNNMFINYMDEDTVSDLEAFLNIIPLNSQSLSDRKKVLTSHFKGYGKLSASTIKETSAAYNLEAETLFDERDEEGNFILRIKLHVPRDSDNISDYVENIKILDVRIPAHLKKIYDVLFDTDSNIGLVEIPVFRYHFSHDAEGVNLDNAPTWLADDDGTMLLDDKGNVLIEERSDVDVSEITTD